VCLVQVIDCRGKLARFGRYSGLRPKRVLQLAYDLIVDGLSLGEHPRLEHRIRCLNFTKNVIDGILALQETRMCTAPCRVIQHIDDIHTDLRAVKRDGQSVRSKSVESA
jgi:hypothetical protein